MAAKTNPITLMEPKHIACYASLTSNSELIGNAQRHAGTVSSTAHDSDLNHKGVVVSGPASWLNSDVGNVSKYVRYSVPQPTEVETTVSSLKTPAASLQKFLRELDEIKKLDENWDGEGADKPSDETIASARELINLAFRFVSTFTEADYFVEPIQPAFLSQMHLLRLPWIFATGNRYGSQATGLLTFDKSLIATSRSGADEDKFAQLKPGLYPTVDGGVTLKLFFEGKELKCTAMGGTIEVIRWKSSESYESDGLWELNIEQIWEHLEWLMKPFK
jgi:hypothetical protein